MEYHINLTSRHHQSQTRPLLYRALYLMSVILFKCLNSEWEIYAPYSALKNPHSGTKK